MRILCLLAVLLLPSATSAQASDPADEFASFDRFLGEFREDNSVPALSAVIVRDGQIAWEGYYGWADDEGEVATSADTTYKIASTTKPIAAMAILAEALAGGLSLDLPMRADEGLPIHATGCRSPRSPSAAAARTGTAIQCRRWIAPSR